MLVVGAAVSLVMSLYRRAHAVRLDLCTYMDLRGRRESMTISSLEVKRVTHNNNNKKEG